MAWEIYTYRGDPMEWAHWLDLSAARAWQQRLRVLRDADINFSESLGALWSPDTAETFPGIMRWQRDCFVAASNVLAALNQPAAACPYYVAAYRGQVGGGSFGAWDADLMDRVLGASQHARDASPVAPNGVRELGFLPFTFPRVALWVDGTVVDRYLTTMEPPDPAQGPPDERFCNRGGVLAFDSWCFKYWYPAGIDARRLGEVTSLATIEQNLALLNGFARQLATEDLIRLVTRSRVWVAAKNLAEARRFGGTLVEDIARVRAADDVLNATADPTLQDVGEYGRTIGAAVGAVNPLVGAIIAGLASLPEVLQSAFGRAVARSTDMWGRIEPVYELAARGGTIGRGRQEAPPYRVDPLPPLDWSAYGSRVRPPRWWSPALEGVEAANDTSEGAPVVSLEDSIWGTAREAWGLPADDVSGS